MYVGIAFGAEARNRLRMSEQVLLFLFAAFSVAFDTQSIG